MAEKNTYENYIPDAVPDADLEYFGGEDYGTLGTAIGWGETPAVLVVDMTNAFVSGEYPTGRTDTGRAAVKANERLISTAREVGVPVLYTTPHNSDMYPADYQGGTKSSCRTKTTAEMERWDD